MIAALQTFEGVLAPGGVLRKRICPWDQTNTHIDAGSTVRFWIEVRTYGIGSVHSRIYDLHEDSPAPFNPLEPIRNLDRDVPDKINLVDNEESDLKQGTIIWREIGPVNEHNSPQFERTTDQDNKRTFVVELTNLEPINVTYTLELYFEII